MKRVEEYIEAYTRRCSNELTDGGHADWLTPDHARSVVVIAREETIKEACDWLQQHGMTSHVIDCFCKDMESGV